MRPLLSSLLLCFVTSCVSTKGPGFDPQAETAGKEVVEAEFASSVGYTSPPPALLQPPTEPYRLGPGDKLDIEILSEPDSRAETFVTPDGRLYYNLLPGIEVLGKSAAELKPELETQLAKYYHGPQVTISLVEAVSQRVAVLGRVNNPGNYSLKTPMRVLDALSLAGGLFASRFTGTTEELADLKHSFITRKGEVLPVDFERLIRDGDLSQNIYLQADDFIYLPSSLTNEVYVLGAVTEPRPVGFMNEMNLLGVLGRGLGLRPDADLTRVNIIRGSLTDPKIATVDAKAILTGEATNIRLEPGDIVYIPGAGTISAKSLAREAVNTFVRVVAANEGGNFGSNDSDNVGVSVNVGGTN